jgi:hypothetical protein
VSVYGSSKVKNHLVVSLLDGLLLHVLDLGLLLHVLDLGLLLLHVLDLGLLLHVLDLGLLGLLEKYEGICQVFARLVEGSCLAYAAHGACASSGIHTRAHALCIKTEKSSRMRGDVSRRA